MLTRLLNKTLTVKRISSSISDSGEEVNNVQIISSNVSGRITRNKGTVSEIVQEYGLSIASTHKIFTNYGIDVLEGDYIYDGNTPYVVSYVDKIPGGVVDSHFEIYANEIDTIDNIGMSEVS